MRGKLANAIRFRDAFRNIPAYAGKTNAPGAWVALKEEHPRVCGENTLLWRILSVY